ncbi:MAG: DUF697 domain-containing protein [Saprospiraceae bacterium]|nr:DUF697 domain-containing protein [Candidatus Vicinibacter proximus]MBL7824206.1 DUF697 domain-containing protein [Saprospiraceae bacterium]MCC6843799.1 DUF697 domain-containing protein [Saprospiraceae bacterium]HRG31809.1 DUF697 domain-containing protein [Saprospiraceae bacterium]
MNEKSKTNQADDVIRNHTIWSMGAGMIWVPIVDFLAVSAIQLDMIRQLSKIYGQDFKDSQGKAIISALTSSGASRLAARAVKFIPGVGTILGGVTMSVMSGASTYALGELFKKHFETGGTILDFDPKAFKTRYEELFEKGKEFAQQAQSQRGKQENKQESPATSNPPSDVKTTRSAIDQLKDIAELKEKGLLSEDEYESFKRRILED